MPATASGVRFPRPQKPPATIKLTVGKTPDGAFLSVADTGPGIPETERDRVLNQFVRLESERNTPGNGLGLSLVKAICQFHGARLILGDNAPGLVATLQFKPQTS